MLQTKRVKARETLSVLNVLVTVQTAGDRHEVRDVAAGNAA